MPVLSLGSKGEEVTALQSRLEQLGFYSKGADGIFGPGTKAAVIEFQKSRGLPSDGIPGPSTLAALELEVTKAEARAAYASGAETSNSGASSSKASSSRAKTSKASSSKARPAKVRTAKVRPAKATTAKTSTPPAKDDDTEEVESGEGQAEKLSLRQWLRSRRLSALSREILDLAEQFSNRREHNRDRVTTSCILFAAAELGAQPLDLEVQNSSQFLFRWMNKDELRSRQYKHALSEFLYPGEPERRSRLAIPTSHTTQVIETATNIANFVRKESVTSDRGVIYGRDLIGALLFTMLRNSRLGAARRLTDVDVNLKTLREDYFIQLLAHETNTNDDIEKWRQVIIDLRLDGGERKVPLDAKPSLPSIDSDTPALEDHLNIKSEVRGFANIIAASAVSTPLSIGLFGDWGSGKSTFMEQLQAEVKRISEGVRNKKADEETSFLGNIVQIKFNAWHYAEANLWASLVSHVFDNLSFSEAAEEKKAAGVRKDLLLELVTNLATEKVAEADLQTKAAEVKDKKASYETAKTALDGAQRERDVAKLGLSQLLAQGIWPFLRQVLDEDPAAKGQINAARKVLGKAGLTEEELKREIEASRTTVGQLQLRLSSLISDPSRNWKVGVILSLTILIPVILTFAVAQFGGTGALERLVAGVTPLVTLIGGALAWLRTGRKGVDSALDTLNKAEQQLDELYAKAQSEQDDELQLLREAVAQKETEIEGAKKEVEKAKTEVARTINSLKEMEPARVLEKFVQERAASKDYRKLLGVVALIRRDFKNLSDMLRKQDNPQLREAVTDILKKDKEKALKATTTVAGNAVVDAAAGSPDKGAPKIAAEPTKGEVDAKLEEYRIDRIVLYIDDLDRCPPKQVVDVLQAIHLLLAFELFVVVVGVDARWIRHSLRERFPEMLSEDWDEGNAPKNDADRQGKMATPRDYVEKIFQVPFWLKPMDDGAAQKLLRNLIPEDQILRANKVPGNGGGASQDPNAGAKGQETREGKYYGDSKPDSAPKPDAGTHPAGEAQSNKADGGGEPAAAGTGETDEQSKEPDVVLKPESLLLDVRERDAMIALSRVIGKTPRTLKRFVNVYRIIKAGLDADRLAAFMGTGPSDAQYVAVLVLLSIAHGAPDVAPAFFHELKLIHEEALAKKKKDIGLKALLQHMSTPPPELDESLTIAWSTLIGELHRASKDAGDISLAVLREWLPVVVRYTFQLGRLSDEVAYEKAV